MTTATPSSDGRGDLLAAEMARRWREGDHVRAEEFLTREPGLVDDRDAALRLILEELCLREELNDRSSPEELLARFPQWRSELHVMLDCQRLLEREAVRFPALGEDIGDFHLLAEVGRGGRGRVYIASQLSLADRYVVLKVVPRGAGEHLSLARLQHTNIVPLYSVLEDEKRNLLALCMPYFGGGSLAEVLHRLEPVPPTAREGKDILQAIASLPHLDSVLPRGPIPEPLARGTYAEAVCWVGACLADALHYAHERGLVHLDVKPSNVLLTADGQPMLLDFHLAQAPLPAGATLPNGLGGTAMYASPEQRAAFRAVSAGRAIDSAVGVTSDVYSLGVVLAECLGISPPVTPGAVDQLSSRNPQVSRGLADILSRCVAEEPERRYATAAALAADLRLHLAHRPLKGVRNRSLVERWRKWRRRAPHALHLMLLVLAVLAGVSVSIVHFSRDLAKAEAALVESETLLRSGHYEEAAGVAERGLELIGDQPWHAGLRHSLEAIQQQAKDRLGPE